MCRGVKDFIPIQRTGRHPHVDPVRAHNTARAAQILDPIASLFSEWRSKLMGRSKKGNSVAKKPVSKNRELLKMAVEMKIWPKPTTTEAHLEELHDKGYLPE